LTIKIKHHIISRKKKKGKKGGRERGRGTERAVGKTYWI
jgi:hypothetical protein